MTASFLWLVLGCGGPGDETQHFTPVATVLLVVLIVFIFAFFNSYIFSPERK